MAGLTSGSKLTGALVGAGLVVITAHNATAADLTYDQLRRGDPQAIATAAFSVLSEDLVAATVVDKEWRSGRYVPVMSLLGRPSALADGVCKIRSLDLSFASPAGDSTLSLPDDLPPGTLLRPAGVQSKWRYLVIGPLGEAGQSNAVTQKGCEGLKSIRRAFKSDLHWPDLHSTLRMIEDARSVATSSETLAFSLDCADEGGVCGHPRRVLAGVSFSRLGDVSDCAEAPEEQCATLRRVMSRGQEWLLTVRSRQGEITGISLMPDLDIILTSSSPPTPMPRAAADLLQ